MKVYFADDDLRELYEAEKPKVRRYKMVCRNKVLLKGYRDAVTAMRYVETADGLKELSYLHYERLKYQSEPLSSVRLDNRYVERLLFRERNDGVEVELIEIDSTHYGNKK